MTTLTTLIYSLLALDETVASLAAQYGMWVYAILFVRAKRWRWNRAASSGWTAT